MCKKYCASTARRLVRPRIWWKTRWCDGQWAQHRGANIGERGGAGSKTPQFTGLRGEVEACYEELDGGDQRDFPEVKEALAEHRIRQRAVELRAKRRFVPKAKGRAAKRLRGVLMSF